METQISKEHNIQYISSSGVYKTSFTLIILVQLYFGVIIVILVNLWYYNYLYFYLTGELIYPMSIIETEWFKWIIILLLPLNIYGNMFLFSFLIILFSTAVMRVLNRMNPPAEGIFEKGSKEWKFMHRRFWTAYLPIWLARNTPLPWIDIICYRFFGVRIGKNVVAYEGYIDPVKNLIEIGDFTMTSLNICIFSHLIYQDRVFIKKVKIGNSCIIGPQSIITPGTILEDRAVLGANSYTWIGQTLESDLIHVGTPVKAKFPIKSVEETIQKESDLKKDEIEEIGGGI